MKAARTPAKLDRRSHLPLHRQIEGYFRNRIEKQDLRPGQMLPSVKLICEQFGGINHLTVRQALKNLAAEGLVRSVQGRGTFVADGKRTRRIGLVLLTLGDSLPSEVMRGVQQVVDEADVKTLVLDSRFDSNTLVDNIRQLEDLPLDGAIIFPLCFGNVAEHLVKLKFDGFPFVLVDRYFRDFPTSYVVVDNYRGSYELTSHLIQQGYRRLAWLGSGEALCTSNQGRRDGFRDAINAHGLSYDPSMIQHIEMDSPTSAWEPQFEQMVRQVFSREDPPEGLVCQNDFAAIGCMRMLKKMGLKIPQDVGVAGFDDIPAASAVCEPPLTTVRQPMRQVGIEAARLLLERIENPQAPLRNVVLPVELVVRKSTQAKNAG